MHCDARYHKVTREHRESQRKRSNENETGLHNIYLFVKLPFSEYKHIQTRQRSY